MRIVLDTLSVGDALARSLRERILSNEIIAGQPVTEAALAAEYQVARQTAKAAIERLVSEGLLERTAHKSARVPILSIDRIADLYYARQFMECRAYELLAAQSLVPNEASVANQDFHAAARAGDRVELVEADVRFHRALVAGLSSAHLDRAHTVVINEMRLCLAQVQEGGLLDPAVIAGEHDQILDAIRSGDATLASEFGRRHLANAEEKLLTSIRH